MTENNKCPSATAKTTLAGNLPADCAAVMVYTTFPSLAAAEAAGRTLVAEKLAGCINILPQMVSIYAWKGEIERTQEAVLIAKTRVALAERCAARIRESHPYETPALLIIPVPAGAHDYLEWLRSGTAD